MKMKIDIEPLHFNSTLTNIEAYTTLRGEVHASDAYSQVNLCHYTGDRLEHVEACRRALCVKLGIEPPQLVMPRQTHSVNVATLNSSFFALTAAEQEAQLNNIDALVTTLPGVAIGINTADCVPIVLADPVSGIIAAAHAGWKGTVNRIAAATVQAMISMGASAQNIHAAIGASICRDCFEVGDEVVQQFAQAGFDIEQIVHRNAATGKAHIWLQQANLATLVENGVSPSNIAVSNRCTRCNPNTYFSARRLGINSGRTFTCIIRRK
ncbi:MAG: peptidoglycan editing factor PgeF [Muribaculaceae bacterium]